MNYYIRKYTYIMYVPLSISFTYTHVFTYIVYIYLYPLIHMQVLVKKLFGYLKV